MNQSHAHHPSADLVNLMRLEEGARSCTTREQALALIRESVADALVGDHDKNCGPKERAGRPG